MAVLGGLVGLTVVVVVIWPVPTLFYGYVPDPKDRSAAEATTRTGMLAGLAGLAALGTFWLNNRVYRITARTFEVTEQGHITDRYTRAIGQLGDEKLDIRLGGIYALERLAVDSERDHPTVVEVLSAFARERSKPPEVPTSAEAKPSSLATDVQATLTVLGRLPMREVSRGDLSGSHLSDANLVEAILTGADLVGAILTGARLVGADLSGANLMEADLSGANLMEADLSGANLVKADLSGANLVKADLTGASLIEADLSGANLVRAELSGANLSGANLAEALLTQAQVDSAAPADPDTWLPEKIARPESWDRRPF